MSQKKIGWKQKDGVKLLFSDDGHILQYSFYIYFISLYFFVSLFVCLFVCL
jgi:hypothetical protein